MKNLSTIILASIFTIFASIFTGCDKDEVDATVSLKSYEPTLLVRGAEVKFTGENLSGVTSIIFPDGIEVVTFTHQSNTEIKAIVPQEAVVGFITLKYSGGEVKTPTQVSFADPVSISSISPIDRVLEGGEVLTINGDYLMSATAVEFANGVRVVSEKFTSQAKEKIELAVPKIAASGKIKLILSYGNVVLSEDAIQVAIIVPSVTSIAPTTIKAGTNLTLTGTNLDVIAKIVFTDGGEIVDFVSVSGTELVVTVPANAKDGKIKYIPYAGVEAETAEAITLVKPTITSFAPTRIDAGANFTIAGTDLDLVTSVLIGTIACDITAKTATSLTVKSATTVATGKITIKTGNGYSAETAESIDIIPPPPGILWEGSMDIGWDAPNIITIPASKFSTATGIKVEFTQNSDADGCHIKYEAGDDEIAISLKGHFDVASGATSHTITLSGKNITDVAAKGLSISGEGITITRVSEVEAEILPSGVLFQGAMDIKWAGAENVLIHRSIFEGDTTLKIDYTLDSKDSGSLKYYANWVSLFFEDALPDYETGEAGIGGFDLLEGTTSHTVTISGENLTKIQKEGFRITGDGITVTKVSIVKP